MKAATSFVSSQKRKMTLQNLLRFFAIAWQTLWTVAFVTIHPSKLRQRSAKHIGQHDDDKCVTDDLWNKHSIIADDQRRSLFRAIVLGVSTPSFLVSTCVTSASQSLTTSGFLVPTPTKDPALSWPLGKVAFSLLPLAGTSSRRATVQEEVVPDSIWTHDQIQGIVNVNVPVRQTVVRLSPTDSSNDGKGGLWVHNPVAPTPQLLEMMDKLVEQYGPVRHIVLGTVALEHKATLAAFASHYPEATVWLQPGQWSFPIDIPVELYGLVQRGPRLREIPVSLPSNPQSVSKQYSYYAARDPIPEWTKDIDYEVLGPFRFNSVGGFSETAFFHRVTKTLIITDCVASVTVDPPPIIAEDPRALVFHARDFATENIPADTLEVRRKGWRRMVQFGLVFFPSQISVVTTVGQALSDARNVPSSMRNLGQGAIPGDGTLFPWTWPNGDADIQNFEAISRQGKLFCPPILTKLILDREPASTLDFCNRVCTRFQSMQRVIPCHLNNNVQLTSANEFYEAFDPLRSTPENLVPQRALAEDLALLQAASDLLTKYGVVAPSQICDGEPARQQGRFASVS